MEFIHVDEIEGLSPNFKSTDPNDFVEILNKISNDRGGVSNMGVFSDITSITQTKEMVAIISNEYVMVHTNHLELPHKDLSVTDKISNPFQLELDTLAGKKKSSLPPVLAKYLKLNKIIEDGSDLTFGLLDGTIEDHTCDTQVDCNTCHGDGCCKDCTGSGKVDCKSCHGSGWCADCKGYGYFL